MNFIGNIEARDIPEDAADVVVCDGFTGNVILKLYEGVAMTLMNKIKGILTKNLKTKNRGGHDLQRHEGAKKGYGLQRIRRRADYGRSQAGI